MKISIPLRRPFAVFLLTLLLAGPIEGQSIQTIAGGGTDDGRPATVVALDTPSGVAIDRLGNIYIADSQAHRVQKVNAATGIITTIAGIGATGFTGDGGPATQASLSYPHGIAVDRAGNVYIADSGNNRVRKVSAETGIITTFAGSDRLPDGDGGPATSARLYYPTALAFDHVGDLYIADSYSNRIRKVSAVTGVITIAVGTRQPTNGFAGDGGPATAALLWDPRGVAVDAAGHLYIADRGNHRVRGVNAMTGIITTIAGNGVEGFSGDGGAATAASLAHPRGVAVDASGNIYVSEYENHRVRKIIAASGIIMTSAGSASRGFAGDGGPATTARLFFPEGIAFDDSGNLFIADSGNDRIRRVSSAGVISTVAGSGAQFFLGDGGPATAAILRYTKGVALDANGNLFIVDRRNNRIRKVSSATQTIATVVGAGSGSLGDGGAATRANISPADVDLDQSGNLFIADGSNYRVRKVNATTGIITTLAGTGTAGFSGDGGAATAAALRYASGVAVDRTGDVYIADEENQRVRKVAAATGTITTIAGSGPDGFSQGGFAGDGGPATAARLNLPSSVALDASGNLYIAERGNSRIRRVHLESGIISTVAGTGVRGFSGDGGPATLAQLREPEGVATDPSGNLYISDTINNRVRKVSVNGIITTVAGSGAEFLGTGHFSGDGGPATAASLSGPEEVAVDTSGNLYISDSSSSRVRAVYACVNVATPLLVSPAEGSTGVSTSPRLSWSAARGAFRYDVLIDTVSPPRQLLSTDVALTTISPANLAPGTRYYWQVVAKGDPYCVPFSVSASAVREFMTSATCDAPAEP